MPSVDVRLPERKQNYEIKIGAGTLSTLGAEARACLGSGARRVALISNSKVSDLYGGRVRQSLKAERFKVVHWLMPEGERQEYIDRVSKMATPNMPRSRPIAARPHCSYA